MEEMFYREEVPAGEAGLKQIVSTEPGGS